MQHDSVILHTRERFPGLAREDFQISPLEKGGSGRKFYRLRSAEAASMIVVKYTPQRPENLRYVDIANFLDDAGVAVPRIYFHDSEEGLIWMQDLGEIDLWSYRDEAWSTRKPHYESALAAVCQLHCEATTHYRTEHVALELEFDEQLYLWEQNYFVENCLVGFFGLSPAAAARYASLPALHAMAADLAREDRVLVHRDFQSQNVLVHEGGAWLIDFQGMRPGLAQYDLASLLYDPYVVLSDTERSELLAFYRSLLARRGIAVAGNFDAIYHRCAAQRLMQALGAYGFLGVKSGRADFLGHIPAARRSLREVAARIDGLDEFVALLNSLP